MLPAPAVLQAIASPRRREILRLIWREERAAGDIHRAMPDVTFGAVSLHLKTLAQAGLVEARVEHRHRYYRARRDVFGPVGRMLEAMWDDALTRLSVQAELDEARRGPRGARTERGSRGPRERARRGGRGGKAPRTKEKKS